MWWLGQHISLVSPPAACVDLHLTPSSPDNKDDLRSELQSLKGNLLGDEDDHALSQGTRVGPSRQASVIVLRVQSGLVVYLSQEFLGGVIYCWDLTCQREQLKN